MLLVMVAASLAALAVIGTLGLESTGFFLIFGEALPFIKTLLKRSILPKIGMAAHLLNNDPCPRDGSSFSEYAWAQI